ncbi:MAG: hypothetical protein J5J00_12585 [Deltaproteobacteria bacterium]|nr:hypothetical protein [Deltaproteobacteria bacterium]
MKINKFLQVALVSGFLFVSLSFLVSQSALAAAGDEKKKEDSLPRSGSLSSTITGSYGSQQVPEPWGGTDVAGQGTAPISGSVSKGPSGQWIMRIFNNSDETYSVDVSVTQYNRSGASLKKDFFSATLRPAQSSDRTISNAPNSENASLELVSWKKLTSKKEAENTPAAK